MKSTFRPLSQALGNIHFWLSRDEASRLMVAAPSMAAMKRRRLPDHVSVTPNKQRGPRVKSRKAPFVEGGRVELAIWPEAGISEYTLPVLGCVISGQADLRAADYILHCQPGDIILFPAGIPKCNSQKSHLEGNSDGRGCDVLWINKIMPAMKLGCYICQSRGLQHFSLHNLACLIPDLTLEHLFEGCCEELQERGPSKMTAQMLSLIISLLKRAIDEDAAQALAYANPQMLTKPDASHHPIEQACLYIDSHLKSHLTIENVARHVYLSSTQFTRNFREYTGQTFHEYLTAQRLKQATRFLRETNMRVQDICLYMGIKPNQLRNLFQEEYGCTPKEFRHRHHSS
jgi:AraC-like DNA-binding protein